MAIRSKPQQRTPAPASDERAVEAFIGKGGGVTQAPAKGGKITRLQLRLPEDILKRIDSVRPKGIAAPSRHDWFLLAMLEKLEREETTR
ncbi:MAG: hypothetical protein WA663_05275 [Candidatus Acidiferrales bacterium]